MSTHTPLRLPESMTRDDIGPYMRGLREHFGLSQQDVSERLHIRHRYIDAIETAAFEQMPGKAYAKGYVHTYAEFLGLDADQAVEICFGAEPVREQQRHFVPEPMKRGGSAKPGMSSQWRSLAVLGVVAAIIVLGVVQFTTGGEDEQAASGDTVADVPEDMLDEMRTLLMPNGTNYDCLAETSALGCEFDTAEWRQLAALTAPETLYFMQADYAAAHSSDEADDKEEKPEEE